MFTKLFGILVALVALLGWTAPTSADTGNEWKEVCSDCHEPGEMSTEKVEDVADKILLISVGTLKHKKAITLSGDKTVAAKEAADFAIILTSHP